MIGSIWLLVAVVVILAMLLLLAFAMVSVAKNADRQTDAAESFSLLRSLRSPSGKPFFASEQSVRNLSEALRGVSGKHWRKPPR